jgi:hypothetical protein
MAHRDYEEFLESLNSRGVRYLIAGAHALGYHARPRATRGIDIFFDPSAENARKVRAAIRDFFGGADLGFTMEDLTNPKMIIHLGVAPVRIDLIGGPAGIADFSDAWRRRVDDVFGAVKAHYLSLADLIASKQAAGRLQDKADLRVLQRAAPRKGSKIVAAKMKSQRRRN